MPIRGLPSPLEHAGERVVAMTDLAFYMGRGRPDVHVARGTLGRIERAGAVPGYTSILWDGRTQAHLTADTMWRRA